MVHNVKLRSKWVKHFVPLSPVAEKKKRMKTANNSIMLLKRRLASK